MQVSGVSNIASLAAAKATSAAVQGVASAAIGSSNDFMKLLLAQLTHQNPMEPMKDNEMMSQYASLNSVQELQTIRSAIMSLNAGSQVGYAASLIGKEVKATQMNGEPLNGKVTGVLIDGGRIWIQVGEKKAPLDYIDSIKDA